MEDWAPLKTELAARSILLLKRSGFKFRFRPKIFSGLLSLLLSQPEISVRLLKEVLLKWKWRLHREGFSPGWKSSPRNHPVRQRSKRQWTRQAYAYLRSSNTRVLHILTIKNVLPFTFSGRSQRLTDPASKHSSQRYSEKLLNFATNVFFLPEVYCHLTVGHWFIFSAWRGNYFKFALHRICIVFRSFLPKEVLKQVSSPLLSAMFLFIGPEYYCGGELKSLKISCPSPQEVSQLVTNLFFVVESLIIIFFFG